MANTAAGHNLPRAFHLDRAATEQKTNTTGKPLATRIRGENGEVTNVTNARRDRGAVAPSAADRGKWGVEGGLIPVHLVKGLAKRSQAKPEGNQDPKRRGRKVKTTAIHLSADQGKKPRA